jgi:hypothetical protein
VTVLSVPFAGRRAATRCAAVQAASPLLRRWAPAHWEFLEMLFETTNEIERERVTGPKDDRLLDQQEI